MYRKQLKIHLRCAYGAQDVYLGDYDTSESCFKSNLLDFGCNNYYDNVTDKLPNNSKTTLFENELLEALNEISKIEFKLFN